VTLPEEIKINPYLLKASRRSIDIDPDAYKKPEPPRQLEPIGFLGALAAASTTIPSAMESIGTPSPQHIDAAREILHSLPEQIKKIAHDSYDVQALVYCFLLDKHRGDVLEQQLAHLEKQVSADIHREVLRIKDKVMILPPRHRLPLMDIAITTLKQLSRTQYQSFKANMLVLIKSDKVLDLGEWAIFRMVIHHLESKASKGVGYKSLPTLHREIQSL